jgi:hypothetical protein
MHWEFLGKQELQNSESGGKGHVYSVSMWRSPVPSGWLLMTVNNRSSDPQPIVSFYPDADHVWKGNEPAEANYLLRPADAGEIESSDQLLRSASDVGSEQKRLER